MLINREQQRVIDEVEQNILLLASAGTGKTNTLAYRVAHLIEGGYAKAENILCLTFTNSRGFRWWRCCNSCDER